MRRVVVGGTLLKSHLRTAVIGLGVLLMVNPVQAAGIDSHTSYIGSNFEDYYANLPAAKVEWSTTMDLPALENVPTDYLMGKGLFLLVQVKFLCFKRVNCLPLTLRQEKLCGNTVLN